MNSELVNEGVLKIEKKVGIANLKDLGNEVVKFGLGGAEGGGPGGAAQGQGGRYGRGGEGGDPDKGDRGAVFRSSPPHRPQRIHRARQQGICRRRRDSAADRR